jgi:hypothetical protein
LTNNLTFLIQFLPKKSYFKDNQEKDIIRQALNQWEIKTCLEFKEVETLSNEVHHLKITKGQG